MVRLEDGDRCLLNASVEPAQLAGGAAFTGLPVEAWWPNREGAQKTYRLSVHLPGDAGTVAALQGTIGAEPAIAAG